MKNVIIVFCGKARAGKNTAAKMVNNHVFRKWVVREFAFAQKFVALISQAP